MNRGKMHPEPVLDASRCTTGVVLGYLCRRLSPPQVSRMAARLSALEPSVSTPTKRRTPLVSPLTPPCHLIWLTTLYAVAEGPGACACTCSVSATPSTALLSDVRISCAQTWLSMSIREAWLHTVRHHAQYLHWPPIIECSPLPG